MAIKLYPILSADTVDLLPQIADCCSGSFVQLRVKSEQADTVRRIARRFIDEIQAFPSLIPVLNDYPCIAVEEGFSWVHVGQEDMSLTEIKRRFPDLHCGVSTHTPEQFCRATDDGADYVAFGPIFTTETKQTGYDARLDYLPEIMTLKRTPVVLIGGITPDTVRLLPDESDIHAAVISALPLFLRRNT